MATTATATVIIRIRKRKKKERKKEEGEKGTKKTGRFEVDTKQTTSGFEVESPGQAIMEAKAEGERRAAGRC